MGNAGSRTTDRVFFREVAEMSDPRHEYMRRLGVGVTERPAASISLILLDWDDTLFCTTEVQRGRHLSCEQLSELGARVNTLLHRCVRLAPTAIITNAMAGWVEHCVATYIPEVAPVLAHIQVISARSVFEARFPNDPILWKCEAFAMLKDNSRQIANLIAIGDQEAEMEAVAGMAKLYHMAFVKSVRFVPKPHFEELLKELSLTASKIQDITHKAQCLRISLQRI